MRGVRMLMTNDYSVFCTICLVTAAARGVRAYHRTDHGFAKAATGACDTHAASIEPGEGSHVCMHRSG